MNHMTTFDVRVQVTLLLAYFCFTGYPRLAANLVHAIHSHGQLFFVQPSLPPCHPCSSLLPHSPLRACAPRTQ